MDLQTRVIYFSCLIVAVILHEISHGVVALWFGDDTAKKDGRLTLNPVPHIDPFGSIIMPAFGAISGIPVIAWAKPVPVNPNHMRHPRGNMLWVGLVGPFTNFMLMAVGAVVARSLWSDITVPFGATMSDLPVTFLIAYYFALANLFLGIFNLLPIPPLDGSSLLERILPQSWLPHWYRFRPYGMMLLFALVFFTPLLKDLIDPFQQGLWRFIVQ
ncbi:MAG: site-2 protease family protein [Acidimicrobiia bacterium]